MKRISCFVSALLIHICLSVSADDQFDIIYEDSFEKNTKGWTEVDREEVTFRFRDGAYSIEHKQNTYSWHTWVGVDFDRTKDYMIDTIVDLRNGNDQCGFALVWAGGSKWKNFWQFSLWENGYYEVKECIDNHFSIVIPKTYSEKIKQGESKNRLTIRKNEDTFNFFINGNKVSDTKANLGYGNQLGYSLHNRVKVDVLDLRISGVSGTTEPAVGNNAKESKSQFSESHYSGEDYVRFKNGQLKAWTLKALHGSHKKYAKDDLELLKNMGFLIRDKSTNKGWNVPTLSEFRTKQKITPLAQAWNGKLIINTWKSVSVWDIATEMLERVILATEPEYLIRGVDSKARQLVLAKHQKSGDAWNCRFSSYDSFTGKKHFDLQAKKKVRLKRINFGLEETRFAVSPDGTYFSTISATGMHYIWSLKTGEMLSKTRTETTNTTIRPYLKFSPNSKQILMLHPITESKKRTGAIYSFSPLQPLREISIDEDEFSGECSFSPDNNYLLVGHSLQSTATGKVISKLDVNACYFSTNGKFLLNLKNENLSVLDLSDELKSVDTHVLSFPNGDSNFDRDKLIISTDCGKIISQFRDIKNDSAIFSFHLDNIKLPSSDELEVDKGIQKAARFFEAGLIDEAIKIAEDLYTQYPYVSYKKHLWAYLYRNGFPALTVSKSLLAAREHLNDDVSVYGFYNVYAHCAITAGHGELALKSLEKQKVFFENSHPDINDQLARASTLMKALGLKTVGKDPDAYALLIERVNEDKTLVTNIVSQMTAFPETWETFLKDRKKLEAILEEDLSGMKLPKEPIQRQDFLDMDGNLVPAKPPVVETEETTLESQSKPLVSAEPTGIDVPKSKLNSNFDRSISLIKGGLIKRGVKEMKALIASDYETLCNEDYAMKMLRSDIPAILAGELILHGLEQAQTQQERANLLFKFIHAATYARQPVAIQQGIQALKEIQEEHVNPDDMQATQYWLDASVMLLEVQELENAWDMLFEGIDHVEGFVVHCMEALQMEPDLYGPLLEHKKTLALVLEVEEEDLPIQGDKLFKKDFVVLNGEVISDHFTSHTNSTQNEPTPPSVEQGDFSFDTTPIPGAEVVAP